MTWYREYNVLESVSLSLERKLLVSQLWDGGSHQLLLPLSWGLNSFGGAIFEGVMWKPNAYPLSFLFILSRSELYFSWTS